MSNIKGVAVKTFFAWLAFLFCIAAAPAQAQISQPVGGGGGGGSGCTVAGTSGDLQMKAGSSCAASHLNDNGTLVRSSEDVNTSTHAVLWEIPNDTGTGTTLGKLIKLTGAPSSAILATTSDTTYVFGVVAGGAGVSGNALVAVSGQVNCVFDGAATAGHFVIVSTSIAGDCRDGGATEPGNVAVVGTVLASTGVAATEPILLYPPTIASTGSLPPFIAYWNQNQSWTKSQRNPETTLGLVVATATPNFDSGQNFILTLGTSCPCTFANPSTTPVSGQTGVLVVLQDGTGSRTITTWGSDYITAGGTASLVLSTGANSRDYFSYYVDDATHIVLAPGVANAVH